MDNLTPYNRRYFRWAVVLVAIGAVTVVVTEAAKNAALISGVTEDLIELTVYWIVLLPILWVLSRLSDVRGVRIALVAMFVLLVLGRLLDIADEFRSLDNIPALGLASPLHRPLKNLTGFTMGCLTLLVFYWLLSDMMERRHGLEQKVAERTADLRSVNHRLHEEIARRRRAEAELRLSHDELEVRIEARTLELTTANRELATEVDQRQQAEQSLRESEERFRMLVENVPAQIVRISTDGVVRYFNHFLRIERPDTVVGRKLVDFLHKGSVAEFEAVFRRVVQTKEDGELELSTKNGPTFLCRLVAHQTNGEVDSVLAVASDITRRKQAEDRLREFHRLVDSIRRTQLDYLSDTPADAVFNQLLENVLSLTGSQCGFIGEIRCDDHDQRSLLVRAITNLAFDPSSAQLGRRVADGSLALPDRDKLFSRAAFADEVVISNDPLDDPCAAGFPPGLPPIRCFLGMPIRFKGELVGMLAIANRPDGFDQALADYLQPYLASCGAIVGAYRADQARQRAEGQLRLTQAAVENAADAMFTIRPDGRFIDVNRTSCLWLEYTRDELVEMSVSDIDPNYPSAAWPEMWEIVKQQGHVIRETLHRSKSGRVFPVEVVAGHIEFEGREYVSAFVRDITARKAAEDALRNSEQRFHSLAEAAPVGIVHTDADGRCVYVNQRWCDMAGIAPEDVAGYGWAQTINSTDRKRIHKLMQTGKQTGKPITAEVRIEHADGSISWALGQATAVHDRDQVVGFIGGSIDITESKQAESQLQHLYGELEHVNRVASMGEITSAIAHELNQPLGSIANFAEGSAALLRGGGLPADELAGVLDDIASEALRAGEVTRSLRRFVAKRSAHRAVLNVNQLVQATSRLLETHAQDHRVRLRFVYDTKPSEIEADAIQIQQVILNLVRNAVEATLAASNPGGEVVIATSRFNGSVRVRVSDHGAGVPAADIQKIWEPYFTTKPAGLGMGLCIAQRIVRANGGELSAAANPRRGMTFEIRMPVHIVEGD